MDIWDVCVIRSMNYVWGMTITEIANRMGRPRTTVRDIVNRVSWKHVPAGGSNVNGTPAVGQKSLV